MRMKRLRSKGEVPSTTEDRIVLFEKSLASSPNRRSRSFVYPIQWRLMYLRPASHAKTRHLYISC
jgi:hypothetical protein